MELKNSEEREEFKQDGQKLTTWQKGIKEDDNKKLDELKEKFIKEFTNKHGYIFKCERKTIDLVFDWMKRQI